MMDLSVAVIASSGGGMATLGHTNPADLLQTIHYQLGSIGGGGRRACVRYALYVSLDGGRSMDNANENLDTATLYQVDDVASSSTLSSCHIIKRGTLKEVNAHCGHQQQKIAKAIKEGHVQGLICISCHAEIFRETLQAAASMNLPVTGSGGTSLSQAATLYGIHLVGNSGGSVAATSFTRAVSYTHALSTYWKVPYQPWKKADGQVSGPSAVSCCNACLPAFWGVCLARSVLVLVLRVGAADDRITTTIMQPMIHMLEDWVLPTACAVIMATSSNSAATQQETATTQLIMASIIASSSCSRSILSGLLVGWLVSRSTERLLYWCIFNNIPATMTNLLTAGGVGSFFALIVQPVSPLLQWLTASLRTLILSSIVILPSSLSATISPQLMRPLLGSLWGILSCYGSKYGYYHAIHLPLILVEMETGDASFLGAIDELTLVLVCAGICLGNLTVRAIFTSKDEETKEKTLSILTDADAALCRRGLRTNLCYGDFIEACYPYMEKSWLINAGGYAGSALSSAWLVSAATTEEEIPKSLAYLPFPISVALAGPQLIRFAVASLLAMAVPFLATLLHHAVLRRR